MHNCMHDCMIGLIAATGSTTIPYQFTVFSHGQHTACFNNFTLKKPDIKMRIFSHLWIMCFLMVKTMVNISKMQPNPHTHHRNYVPFFFNQIFSQFSENQLNSTSRVQLNLVFRLVYFTVLFFYVFIFL